jgi:hypothetical protein
MDTSKHPANGYLQTSGEMSHIVELANQIVWKDPDLNLLREHPKNEYALIAQTLQTQLKKIHARGTLFLPDLRAFDNPSVGVFSDYGGESTGDYYVYSARLRCVMHWLADSRHCRHSTMANFYFKAKRLKASNKQASQPVYPTVSSVFVTEAKRCKDSPSSQLVQRFSK